MRIRNFYRSRSDLDKMQGVRQFLVPIVTKFYNGEVDGAMRIKESSLPLQTLFNAVDTILARLEDTENPELLVGDINHHQIAVSLCGIISGKFDINSVFLRLILF